MTEARPFAPTERLICVPTEILRGIDMGSNGDIRVAAGLLTLHDQPADACV
ncbi:MAG: hypothetical protein H6816_08885 [Phycisphaerales bacterium]|nr:hypothetical protein [Phycisphaerales bacterium]